jgi:Rrf2 family transcriptional regulator, nitric oxide-sensitive transcriptional repressor
MFSTTSEYAIRALSFVARVPRDQAVLGRELARQTGIPSTYLSKILVTLRNAGILDATRGTGGGYRLSIRPEEIRLIHVVELFESVPRKTTCFFAPDKECSEETPCTAHKAMRNLKTAYLEMLNTTTLASVAGLDADAGDPTRTQV